MHNKTTTAVEITVKHIKLIQSQPSALGVKISKLFVRDIDSGSLESISAALKELLSNAKIKSAEVVLSIPRQLLTLRVIKLPSQDKNEIKKMVELQVPKQIPWAVEDIVSDYSIIEKDSSGYSRVLLAVCQKDVIKRHLNILSSCGLKAGGIALSSEGVCRWFRYFSHKNNIKEAKPVVLLDINAQATDICFYHKENLVFTRSVAFGLADLKNDKIGELVEELHKTFSSLQRDEIVSEIGKIIITADLDLVNNLAVKLNLDFGCEVVARNSLNEAALEKKLIVPLALSEGKCAATSILGFALDGSRRSFNLFPPEIKNQEEEKKKIKDLAFLGLALVLVLVFSAAALAGKIYKKEQYLKSLAAALKEDNPKAQKIEGLIKKLNLVKDRLNPQGTSIDMIRELY
jgi:Tfp pilus assembly protein, ATPase PilM